MHNTIQLILFIQSNISNLKMQKASQDVIETEEEEGEKAKFQEK